MCSGRIAERGPPCFARLTPFRFHAVMVLAAVSRLHPLLPNLYGLFAALISHTASAFHIIHPPQAAIKKVCLSQSVAYTFSLPCGGGATCWRLPSLNTELMLCFAGTRPRLIQECHAKQPTPEPRDRKSTRLNSSHLRLSRMPSSA